MAQSIFDLLAAAIGRVGDSNSGSSRPRNGSGSTVRNSSTEIASDGTPINPLFTYGDNHPTQTRGSQTLIDILKSLGMDVGNIEQLIALLSQIPGIEAKDYQDQLYQLLLKQYLTAEQRNFDKNALSEQRSYDSPLNQLLRLQGAGIGRNAALQMLQGGADPALVGSGAEAALPSTVNSPSDKLMQGLQTGLNFVSTISQLVGMGFSIPQSIMQTRLLANQNILTESQINAYKSTGQAYSILHRAGASLDSFASVSNAVNSIQKLADEGNTDAAQFVAQGGTKAMLDNASFSSQTLSQLAKSERSYADYKEAFSNARKQERLNHNLTQMDIDKEAADIQNALAELIKTNAEIQSIYQQIELGEIEIQIAGETLKQEKAETDVFETNRDLLISSLNEVDSETGMSGFELASHDQFVRILESFEESAAHVENREEMREYFRNNVKAAHAVALTNYITSNSYKMNITDENNGEPTFMNKILRFKALLRDSGIGDDIKFAVKTGTDIVSKQVMPAKLK